jgi:hypothetical protein
MAKVFKGSLLRLSSEGRLTLQIPDMALMLSSTTPAPELEDIPDDWVYMSDYAGVPTTGRSGFLRFTKTGYLENAEALQNAYANGVRRRMQNPNSDIEKAKRDFHDYAMSFYANAKMKIKRSLLGAQNKVNRLTKMYDEFIG